MRSYETTPCTGSSFFESGRLYVILLTVKNSTLSKAPRARQYLNYALLVLWALVIFYLSSEGHDASSGRSDSIVEVVRSIGATAPADVISFWVRKSAHTVAYFIFGILAYRVMRGHGLALKPALGLAVLTVLIYAVSDEFHQSFVPGRSAEVRDVLIDTTAGTVGASLYATIDATIRSRRLNKTAK